MECPHSPNHDGLTAPTSPQPPNIHPPTQTGRLPPTRHMSDTNRDVLRAATVTHLSLWELLTADSEAAPARGEPAAAHATAAPSHAHAAAALAAEMGQGTDTDAESDAAAAMAVDDAASAQGAAPADDFDAVAATVAATQGELAPHMDEGDWLGVGGWTAVLPQAEADGAAGLLAAAECGLQRRAGSEAAVARDFSPPGRKCCGRRAWAVFCGRSAVCFGGERGGVDWLYFWGFVARGGCGCVMSSLFCPCLHAHCHASTTNVQSRRRSSVHHRPP